MYLIDNYSMFQKSYLTYEYFSFESVNGEINARNGVDGKEIQFFLFNGIKLVKMHSDGRLI